MAWEHAIVHLCMDREEEPRYGVHGAVPVEWESNSFLKVVTRWHCASRTKGAASPHCVPTDSLGVVHGLNKGEKH